MVEWFQMEQLGRPRGTEGRSAFLTRGCLVGAKTHRHLRQGKKRTYVA